MCIPTCGVVLQDRVHAERLVLPRDQNFLEACRSGVITLKNHWSKQSRAALLLRNNDLNTLRHCKGMGKRVTHTHHKCLRWNNCVLCVKNMFQWWQFRLGVLVSENRMCASVSHNWGVDFKVEEPEELVPQTKTQETAYCETTNQTFKRWNETDRLYF